MKLNVFYRISNGSYKKDRLDFATKEYCLQNLVTRFLNSDTDKLYMLEDGCNDETQKMVLNAVNGYKNHEIHTIKGGSSAQSFNIALTLALNLPDTEYVYLVEDDYLHWHRARQVFEEGLKRAHYISGYDHPDKYMNEDEGGNPQVDDGGEITRVFRTESCHWKLTNSTTMTFATSVAILRADEKVWRKYTTGTYPHDYDAFLELRNMGRTLATPIPGYSTHTEVKWLSPYRDWSSL